jgi:heptosyltransferase-2
MKSATMNFMNDSAPMHLASSVDAPTTAIFCSTVTSFGFGPLSNNSIVVETKEKLDCRPCGLHGHKECPKKHFKCAENININELLARIN